MEGLPISTYCRKQDAKGLNKTFRKEIEMMDELAGKFLKYYEEGGK